MPLLSQVPQDVLELVLEFSTCGLAELLLQRRVCSRWVHATAALIRFVHGPKTRCLTEASMTGVCRYLRRPSTRRVARLIALLRPELDSVRFDGLQLGDSGLAVLLRHYYCYSSAAKARQDSSSSAISYIPVPPPAEVVDGDGAAVARGGVRAIHLLACHKVTGLGLSRLRHLTSLRVLELNGCFGINDAAIAALADAAPQLVELSLRQCRSLSAKAFPSIARLRGLEALDVSYCFDAVKDEALAALRPLAPTLRELKLEACPDFSVKGVTSIAELQKLQLLDLSGCRELDKTVAPVLATLSHLRCLRLGRCGGMPGAALRTLSGLSGLEELSVSLSSWWADDDRKAAAVDNMQAIQHLSLLGGASVSEPLLRAIARLPLLQTLGANCSKLSGASLGRVNFAPHLRTLRLAGCGGIGSDGLDVIASITSLEQLSLEGCNSVTVRWVSELLERPGNHYRRIDLFKCGPITGDAHRPLSERFPDVKVYLYTEDEL